MKVEDGAIPVDDQLGGWDDALVTHRIYMISRNSSTRRAKVREYFYFPRSHSPSLTSGFPLPSRRRREVDGHQRLLLSAEEEGKPLVSVYHPVYIIME